MTRREITEVIYDTLMKNTQWEQLNIDEVSNTEVDKLSGIITFDYKGSTWEVSVIEVEK